MPHMVKTLIPNVTIWLAESPPLVISDAQTTVTLDDISYAHIPQSAFASSTSVPTELPANLETDVNTPYPGLYYSSTGTRSAYLQDLGTTSGAITVQASFVAQDAALTASAVGALTSSQNATAAANTQTASYVQADVQTIATLANALKTSYNAAQTDIASIRTVVNQLLTDVTNLRTQFNAELTALQTTGGPQKSS